jgi:hypothetical protein
VSSWIQDVVFLAVGVVIILFVLVRGQQLGRAPVELALQKLGVNIKADRLTLFFLLGVLLAGVAVFFRYQSYESQVKEMRGTLEAMKSRLTLLTDELHSFKGYDVRLNVAFPDDVDPRKLRIGVHTKKQTEDVFTLTDTRAETDFGGTWVKLSNLQRGDRIKVVAVDPDGTTWESPDIEIPKTSVRMTRRAGPPINR